MILDPISDLRRLRDERTDWLGRLCAGAAGPVSCAGGPLYDALNGSGPEPFWAVTGTRSTLAWPLA